MRENNHTLEQCREQGETHSGYHWASSPWGDWSVEQKLAYYEGFCMASGQTKAQAREFGESRIKDFTPVAWAEYKARQAAAETATKVAADLIAAEDEVRRLRAIQLSGPCRAFGHNWQFIGGSNAGCEREGKDCVCSIPVFTCSKCGDSDYGDNPAAKNIMAECGAWAAPINPNSGPTSSSEPLSDGAGAGTENTEQI